MINDIINGFRILTDDNIPFIPLHPTGKKDGNKLGKRKRNLRATNVFIKNNIIVCHSTVIYKIVKQFKHNIPVEIRNEK